MGEEELSLTGEQVDEVLSDREAESSGRDLYDDLLRRGLLPAAQGEIVLAELAEKQEALRADMVARFSKSDARVAASQSTLDFLKSQIDVWNAQRN